MSWLLQTSYKVNMNIVYVLVSTASDTYLEQTVLSIESLRKVMKDVNISVLIDKKTEKSLIEKRKKIYAVADCIVVIDVPEEYDKRNSSRFIKTSMYSYMDEDFLYIDADTIICEDLSSIAGDYDIGGVIDIHLKMKDHPLRERFEEHAQRCGFHAGYEDKHFNGGFFWVRKCQRSKEFFELWHKLWQEALQHGLIQDQTSLNEVNYRMNGIIHELDGVWNCQIRRYGSGFQYLSNAKIIHYFASNSAGSVPYDLSNNSLLRHALDEEYPKQLQIILDDPKAAFRGVKYVIADAVTAEMIEANFFKLFRRMYDKKHKLYWGIEKFIAGCVKNLVFFRGKR